MQSSNILHRQHISECMLLLQLYCNMHILVTSKVCLMYSKIANTSFVDGECTILLIHMVV